jgi:hypothetical protein
VARRILGEDVTQIDYYTERVKRMVGKVLTGNGITRYDQGANDLVGGEELSDAEREELLQLCRQRLDAFREQRGVEVFAHSSRHPWRWTTSCPGTMAARTTSATCKPSASAATPASDGRREAGCVFCALEASGRVLLENALEAVHRRCLPGDAKAQPGDSPAA